MTDEKKAIATLRYFVQKATKWNEGADELARAEGVYGALDHITTLTRERDEARRDAAAMREMLATAFREGWNCGDWKEDRDNVSAREYDWMHSAVKAKADAALTAALTQGDA